MEYHRINIHKRIIRNIALNIEILINDRDSDISEYDAQAFMALFLRRNLKNTDYKIKRESFGKYDCVIANREDGKPLILYELKTFVKPKEKLQIKSSYKKIISDFQKLNDGIRKYKDARGFFILVCKSKDLKNMIQEFNFLLEHIADNRTWQQIEEHKNNYKIRPSSKEYIGSTYIFTWEIKPTKI